MVIATYTVFAAENDFSGVVFCIFANPIIALFANMSTLICNIAERDFMELVERIKKLCQERGITLNQLEKAIGLKGTIARWADHEPSVGKVRLVARYFGMTVSDLIEDQWDRVDCSSAQDDDDNQRPTSNISAVYVVAETETAEYLERVRQEYPELNVEKFRTLEELKATVAFIQALRGQK